MKNNHHVCKKFKDAQIIAKQLFEQLKCNIYIFEVKKLYSNNPTYVVSSLKNIVITADSVCEIIQIFKFN